MTTNIAGTYKLTDYGYYYKKDGRFEPISEWFFGYIHYSETGFMTVTIRFKQEPREFSDFVSYSGTYKVQNDEIIHQVLISVKPSYDNQSLHRKFKLENDELELEFENTTELRKFSTWKKI